MRPLLVLCALVLGRAPAVASPPSFPHAAVASDHPLASAAGVEALRRGGNAIDAACATALAVGVLHPQSAGIGGGGFLVAWIAREKRFVVLDFREKAPRAVGRDFYLRGGKADPRLAQVGPLAVGVPGEVAGLSRAVKELGKLDFARCTEAAARLAEGFPAHAPLLRAIEGVKGELPKYPALGGILMPQGKPLAEGQIVRRPELARTLRVLGKDPQSFYRGAIAKEIVRSLREAGGVLTEEDLASYTVKVRAPLETRYRGRRIATMPPPSSGGIVLTEALNLLEHERVGALGAGSEAFMHLYAEVLKHGFADRARHLGDADFVSVPVARLASPAYADELWRRVGPKPIAHERYGSGQGGAPPRDGGTTHLSVVDAEGNAVALTSTVNLYFGSLVIAGSTGILLNDQMDDFSLQPGVPNAFGLVGNAQNAVAPGKRPLSSMSPTIVLENDRVRLVVGAAGGPRIITATLQTLLGVLDFGLALDVAVAAPRLHAQWMPPVVFVEKEVPQAVRTGLAARGHEVVEAPPGAVVNAVAVEPGGARTAASDPRKNGAPAGY